MDTLRQLAIASGVVAVIQAGACAAGAPSASSDERSGEVAQAVPNGIVGADRDSAPGPHAAQTRTGDDAPPAPPGCGDGERSEYEACDDGNTRGGDGCSADCGGIEPGYACYPPGQACRRIARCGDGIVAASEACDDGNTEDGEGCSATCKLELGFKCQGEPSVCTATTCGDGLREGSEGCDDGNALPFDGCSTTCQAEPRCSGGPCSSSCGDGLVLGEACDDGNAKDGDGCSADCEIEDGFTCATDTACEMRDGNCILRVPALFRDFSVDHPDFQVGCGELAPGLLETRLDEEGKPVLAGDGGPACIQSASSFAQWYRDSDANASHAGELVLYDNGSGAFVNRYGPNGERFMGPERFENVVYGGPGGNGCEMCTPSANGQCFDPCVPWSSDQACCAEALSTSYDGNPLFFPLDEAPNALPDARYRAKIPEEYGYDGWPFEDSVFPGAPTHNFYFTTEVVYWFRYEANTSATLEFTGDDDLWVFVNGRLAVDLGGPHVPEDGSVTVDGDSAARFELSPGNVYEVRVFHAERKLEGSSFRLTLSGFDQSPSECTPVCGDGIVTLGEECDDGDNRGGYEQCAEGCVLGPRCGDGVLQDGEDCDDGNRRDGDECGSSCRVLRVD